MTASRTKRIRRPWRFTIRLPLATLLVLTTTVGCSSAGSSRVGEGAGTGAVIGAGIGLLLGALTGRPEAGLLVGTAVGAGQGAYEGWKQDQDDDRTQQLAEAIRESNQGEQSGTNASSRAREELTRFLGVWTMEGWAQEPGGERFEIRAQVNGTVEMTYFVEMAYIDVAVTGFDGQLWGASTLGYDEDTGYTISSRFNTVPEPLRVGGGQFDAGSRTFAFEDSEGRTTLRFENPDRFVSETVIRSDGQDVIVESFRFTKR